MNPEGWIVRHWQGDDLEFSEGELFQDFEQTFQNFFEGFPFDVTPQIQGLSKTYVSMKLLKNALDTGKLCFPPSKTNHRRNKINVVHTKVVSNIEKKYILDNRQKHFLLLKHKIWICNITILFCLFIKW